MRYQLISWAYELSDVKFQRAVWARVPGDGDGVGAFDTIDEVVHFFFDDSTLADDATDCIGSILRNEREAAAVRRLCVVLERGAITDRIGLSDAEMMELDTWPDVVSEARNVLKELVQP